MSDTEIVEEKAAKKKSKLPLVLGLVLALAGGGGGFYAVNSGLLFGGGDEAKTEEATPVPKGEALPQVAFVPVDQLVISLGRASQNKHLLFRSQLEVGKQDEKDVAALLPRIIDVMNSYLRAVDMRDLEDPKALVRIRAQLLRRIQTVVGEGHVHDLLIMEFVLN